MSHDSSPFEVIAEAIADGIVVANAESRILWCNSGAASMFGWTTDEAVGRPLTELMPERYRQGHLDGLARLLNGGAPRLLGHGPVEVEALGAAGREIPVELTLNRWTTADGEMRFVAVLRDVSERRRSERERDAQLAVARALASATETERATQDVLQALALALDWEFGAVWLMEKGGALACAHLWEADAERTAQFAVRTRELTFRRGIGLPGRVWERRRPVWLQDAAAAENFPRLDAAGQAGLHGAVAMPIISGDEFLGVLEFFSGALRTADPAIESILEAVSDQFAQFFRRKQAEDELKSQQLARRQAAEINDHIIHWLVQISQALDAGDQRGAERATHQALTHASRIITDLQALPRVGGRDSG